MPLRTITLRGATALALAAALALGSPAQYATDFEALTAGPAGVILTGQDSFYLPAAAGSTDYDVYTYSGNVLGVAPNPLGGAQFAGGLGAGAGTFERGERLTAFGVGTGTWSLSADVCVLFGGTLPAADNIGSLSLQPNATNQSYIALARWQLTSTAVAWKADYIHFDSAGLQITATVPDPGFQNLLVNNWYRWETIFDLASNRILRCRITDLTTGITSSHSPTTWYLRGGLVLPAAPTGFRLFCGSTVAGNILAFDNINLALAPPEYQVNQPAAGLDLDGVLGTAFAAATTPKCPAGLTTANFSSINPGLPFEVALALSAAVPAGGGAIATAGGQLVNVNLLDPTLTWLNGGIAPLGVPFPGNFSAAFAAPPVPVTISAQLVVADPTTLDGFALSQPVQLVTSATGPAPGPTADDQAVAVTFAASPLCGPTALSFFGTGFTQMQVISNGRVMFGPPNTSFSPTVTQAALDSPWAGAWVDLNPALGGSITVSTPNPATVQVSYSGVAYFGTPGSANSFSISLDTTGLVTLGGLLGITPGVGTMMLGISAGSLGATDPGASLFVTNVPTPSPAGMGMIYEIGVAGTLAPGVNTLQFTPNPNPNYDWLGLP